ncbi:endonuclease/exonuclease/phosphatase family protein [Candidatus Saccharibacteria bacterium]|nr:endonuclease/exonuclease/phosphatase family protein [Candidatus Saccharibacteria bacterium]
MNLKVVCLNIWNGELLEAAVEFLLKEMADIVLAQEVFGSEDKGLEARYRSHQIIESKLGFYSHFAPTYRDFDHTNGKALRGNSVFSRFPIIDSQVTHLSIPYNETYRDVPGNFHKCPRNLQHVKIEAFSKEINVFNVHGPWDLDGDNFNDQRREMADVIMREIKDKPNIILGGDTNATPGNQAIKIIEGKLKNVFDGELKSTFNMRHKTAPGYATAVVDFIFISKDVKIIDKSCPDVDVSDHLPLIASLQIS